MHSWYPDTYSEYWTPKPKKLLCINVTTHFRLLYTIWLKWFCICSESALLSRGIFSMSFVYSQHLSTIPMPFIYAFTCKVPFLSGQEDLAMEGTIPTSCSKWSRMVSSYWGAWRRNAHHGNNLVVTNWTPWVWHSVLLPWFHQYLVLKMLGTRQSPQQVCLICLFLTALFWCIIYAQ